MRPDVRRLVPILAGLGLVAALLAGPARSDPPPPLDPKVRVELAKGARAYLQLEEDPFNGREAVRAVIAKQASAGRDMLANLEDLREIAYQGRPFDRDYRDRKWQKEEPNTEVNEGKVAVSVSRGDKLRLAFSVPKKDYTEAALAKLPRVDPFPTLVSLIEEKDYSGKKYPGEEVLARRYASTPALTGAYKELFEKWILLAPVAVRANYLDNGNVRFLFFLSQLKDFYQRYHVDFERLCLDADATTASAVAAAHPFLLAGVVMRRPLAAASEIDPSVVVNYAHVPIYVVNCEPTAKMLKDAGHPDVTLGDDAGVAAWLSARHRVLPRAFSWRTKTTQQVLAHWMILGPNWNTEERTLKVEVLDTAEDPNTIKIEALGMLDLTVFLNDAILPLSKEVRVVINGKEVYKQSVERSLGRVFDQEPVKVRESMNYGMLFSAMTPRIFVPPPPAKPAGAPAPAPGGDPEKEKTAQELLEKGKAAAADGNTAAATKYLEKVLSDYATTAAAAEAKAELEKLKAPGDGAGK